jgi:RNA polymerase sigma-70 factor (ECF subfamily)
LTSWGAVLFNLIPSYCNFEQFFSYILVEEHQGDQVSEEALWINQALQGDQDAFGFLVEAFQNQVYSLCYRMLGNAHDAEDAAQESFIRAYQNLKRYDPNRSFATWILSIAAHYCIDRTRKRRLPTSSIDVLQDELIPDRYAPEPESSLRKQEKEIALQNLLKELKPIDRATIILRYWDDCSEVEIAEALDLSVSAVKSRLFRARQKLAQSWIDYKKTTALNERRTNESPAL